MSVESLIISGHEQEENLVNPETISNAKNVLVEFVKLGPKEKVLLIRDYQTRSENLQILRKAVEEVGSEVGEFSVDEKTSFKEINKAIAGYAVLLNMSVVSSEAADKFYDVDFLRDNGSRLVCLMDLAPDVFKSDGALSEKLENLEERLNKMEHVLREAVGFRVISSYGTNLEVPLCSLKERNWYKDAGVIEKSGDWDNLPGGEIFTTPDETKVNGVLMLPALNSVITKDQGVDEFVRIEIRNGKISSIQGGKSAEILREQLEKDFVVQTESKDQDDPLTVYQIAEFSFGANPKARSVVADPEQAYNYPGISFIETEKRLGTIHLAFGSSEHGTEGADGFGAAISHHDIVIPRNGLTVEMFKTHDDFKNKKNGQKIISDGVIKFFE